MGAPAPHLPTGTAVSPYPHGSTSPPQSLHRNNSFPISLWEHQPPPISLLENQLPPSPYGNTGLHLPRRAPAPHLPMETPASIFPGEHQLPISLWKHQPLHLPRGAPGMQPCASAFVFSLLESGGQIVDMVWKGLLPSEPSHQPLYLNLPAAEGSGALLLQGNTKLSWQCFRPDHTQS